MVNADLKFRYEFNQDKIFDNTSLISILEEPSLNSTPGTACIQDHIEDTLSSNNSEQCDIDMHFDPANLSDYLLSPS